LKASEENVKGLSEQLERLQENRVEFEEAKVLVADLLEGQQSDTALRNKLKAQNNQLRKLGFRVYTQMMRLEATLRANNKVIADDSWDALIAESEELFYDANEHENEMYGSDGFLRESPGVGKECHAQGSPIGGGLVPLPLFSKENTPEAQDANGGEGGKSGAEDVSDCQVDSGPRDRLSNAEPVDGGVLSDFAKANLLLKSRMLVVSNENPGNGIEQSHTNSSSDISANDDHVHQKNSALAGNSGTMDRSLPVPVDVERQFDVRTDEETVTQEARECNPLEASIDEPHRPDTPTGLDDDPYNLSKEEAKILNQTGRFPERFALPSTQIEEAKRYLYTGSDCGEIDEESDSQHECEQEEDRQEMVEPEENEQAEDGQDGDEHGSPLQYTQQGLPLDPHDIRELVASTIPDVQSTMGLANHVMVNPEVTGLMALSGNDTDSKVSEIFEADETSLINQVSMTQGETLVVQDEVGNNIFYFAAKPSAVQDTNTKTKFSFTVPSSYPQAEDVKDILTNQNSSLGKDDKGIFQFTAASSCSPGNGNIDVLSFTGDSSSPIDSNNGKGVFNFKASSSIKRSVTAQTVDGENKVDERVAGKDSDTSTVVLEPPKVPRNFPVADGQDKDVGHVEIDASRATSAIKSLYPGERAIPLTNSEETLDLSALRDGQEIPVSYTLPAVKDKKREKAKATKDNGKAALKVGGRRIHRKIRL
ncbi:MAG: hypothetical protein Q9187_008149, partial [Circinaria calcarea]